MSEPTKEVKQQIIKNEIAILHNTRYQLEIRHRVNKKLGTSTEDLKPLTDELVKIEAMIIEYENVLNELA